jgi:hypothetical protein
VKLYTPDYDWLTTPGFGALHHATLTRQRARECEFYGGIYDDPVKLDCGRIVTTVLIPGAFSRGGFGGGLPRCKRCCKATGLPEGNGSPKNSDECRRLLGMVAS